MAKANSSLVNFISVGNENLIRGNGKMYDDRFFKLEKRPAPRSQFDAGPPLISDVNQLT